MTVLMFARVGPLRRARRAAQGSRGSSPRCSRRRSSRSCSRSRAATTSPATTSSTARCSSRSSTSRRCARCTTRVTGWLLAQAGYRRRALLVGIAASTSRRSRTRWPAARRASVDFIGYFSLSRGPHNGLRSLGELDRAARGPDAEHRVQEVIIADPDFPQEQAVELVDVCHQRGVTVHVAPSTMEILIAPRRVRARASRCRCSRCARRCSRASTSRSSARST